MYVSMQCAGVCTAPSRQDRFLCIYGHIKWEGDEERRTRGEWKRRGGDREEIKETGERRREIEG